MKFKHLLSKFFTLHSEPHMGTGPAVWTTRPPTEPGYYWAICPGWPPAVVELKVGYDGELFLIYDRVYYKGHDLHLIKWHPNKLVPPSE